MKASDFEKMVEKIVDKVVTKRLNEYINNTGAAIINDAINQGINGQLDYLIEEKIQDFYKKQKPQAPAPRFQPPAPRAAQPQVSRTTQSDLQSLNEALHARRPQAQAPTIVTKNPALNAILQQTAEETMQKKAKEEFEAENGFMITENTAPEQANVLDVIQNTNFADIVKKSKQFRGGGAKVGLMADENTRYNVED